MAIGALPVGVRRVDEQERALGLGLGHDVSRPGGGQGLRRGHVGDSARARHPVKEEVQPLLLGGAGAAGKNGETDGEGAEAGSVPPGGGSGVRSFG